MGIEIPNNPEEIKQRSKLIKITKNLKNYSE
jgi:hypothetical protein